MIINLLSSNETLSSLSSTQQQMMVRQLLIAPIMVTPSQSSAVASTSRLPDVSTLSHVYVYTKYQITYVAIIVIVAIGISILGY
jgi:hypothetical protein